MKKILVTGGAGYIGSHFVVKLIENGYYPVIYDDFSNSHPEVLNRIEQITKFKVPCITGDIRDRQKLQQSFSAHDFWAVAHFAGKKSVNESQIDPLLYYSVNVGGSLCLLDSMKEANVKKLIFSSTATVYAANGRDPVNEDSKLGPINNYGKSKLIIEKILNELSLAESEWNFCVLRYFNPVGAHPSGLIGEDPEGIPANLMPFISQVAIKVRKNLKIFGQDYPTKDGTGARDYIHIEDLAQAHINALEYLEQSNGYNVFNIGTGKSTTVKGLVNAFSRVNRVDVPFEFAPRRDGDIAISYADPTLARKKLNWSSKFSIDDMCRDVWNWQVKNPHGYK